MNAFPDRRFLLPVLLLLLVTAVSTTYGQVVRPAIHDARSSACLESANQVANAKLRSFEGAQQERTPTEQLEFDRTVLEYMQLHYTFCMERPASEKRYD